MNPLVRAALPAVLADQFGLADTAIEPDRFSEYGDDIEAARAAYEAEPEVRVAFESGTAPTRWASRAGRSCSISTRGRPTTPSRPRSTWAATRPDHRRARPGRRGGRRLPLRPRRRRRHPLRGHRRLPAARPGVGDRLDPVRSRGGGLVPDRAVRRGHGVRRSAHADLFVASDAPDGQDVNVQVSLSEVRPDGVEYLVTNGWLDLADRAEDRRRTNGLEIVHPFTERARRPLEQGTYVEARVDIPSFAHVFRAGSQLRLTIATPGRNHATWEFENPDYGGFVPTHPSAVRPTCRRPSCCRGSRTSTFPPCRRRRVRACGAWRAGPSCRPRTRRGDPPCCRHATRGGRAGAGAALR